MRVVCAPTCLDATSVRTSGGELRESRLKATAAIRVRSLSNAQIADDPTEGVVVRRDPLRARNRAPTAKLYGLGAGCEPVELEPADHAVDQASRPMRSSTAWVFSSTCRSESAKARQRRHRRSGKERRARRPGAQLGARLRRRARSSFPLRRVAVAPAPSGSLGSTELSGVTTFTAGRRFSLTTTSCPAANVYAARLRRLCRVGATAGAVVAAHVDTARTASRRSPLWGASEAPATSACLSDAGDKPPPYGASTQPTSSPAGSSTSPTSRMDCQCRTEASAPTDHVARHPLRRAARAELRPRGASPSGHPRRWSRPRPRRPAGTAAWLRRCAARARGDASSTRSPRCERGRAVPRARGA